MVELTQVVEAHLGARLGGERRRQLGVAAEVAEQAVADTPARDRAELLLDERELLAGARARAELRTGARSALVLVLMLGVFGGAVMASAAGARRQVSAYPRFLAPIAALVALIWLAGRMK